MTRIHSSTIALGALALCALLGAASLIGSGEAGTGGRAHVRLVRLLSEVGEEEQAAMGGVHGLRLELERGNVVLLRKDGSFAALLPIEIRAGERDSLVCFHYVERSSFLWLFPGGRSKGISVVADREALEFDSFQLLWKHADAPLGYLYFPDGERTERLRFSVMSGALVDRVDPKETPYWVELGLPGRSGF